MLKQPRFPFPQVEHLFANPMTEKPELNCNWGMDFLPSDSLVIYFWKANTVTKHQRNRKKDGYSGMSQLGKYSFLQCCPIYNGFELQDCS